MLIDILHKHRAEIEEACRQYGATRIRVFGSVARGEERPESDVDFLVDLPRGYDLFGQRIPLTERLAEITGRSVDLIPEHELNQYIKETVLHEAREL